MTVDDCEDMPANYGSLVRDFSERWASQMHEVLEEVATAEKLSRRVTSALMQDAITRALAIFLCERAVDYDAAVRLLESARADLSQLLSKMNPSFWQHRQEAFS